MDSPARITEKRVSDELAADVLVIHTEPGTGAASRIALTSINRGEPDPALFTIPSDYLVSRASQQR